MDVIRWIAERDTTAGDGTSASAVAECDDWYRAVLLNRLDWVHNVGTVQNGVPAGTNTRLCPVTAYLQLILQRTPVEDWAKAAADVAAEDAGASPLAFAWSWARKDPEIGRQTADVVVLVTMGREVNRSMAYAPVKAEEDRQLAAIERRPINLFIHEGAWIALGAATMNVLTGAASWLRASLSDTVKKQRERQRKLNEAKDHLATIKNAADLLGEYGTQYAQLLGEEHTAHERQDCTECIRHMAEFILIRAEPPTPEKVLLVIQDLAKTDY
ncbi:hypothetical protein C0992_010974 [Termitomyces sp. T32_za158]|nr:hypothetical protein C0992_010974 [Termitomyces sp. T32_za158]